MHSHHMFQKEASQACDLKFVYQLVEYFLLVLLRPRFRIQKPTWW